MGCLGYFSTKGSDLRMPRTENGKDELGIRYEGEVLTGQKGVREAIELGGIQAEGAEGGGQAIAYPTGTPEQVVDAILRKARGK